MTLIRSSVDGDLGPETFADSRKSSTFVNCDFIVDSLSVSGQTIPHPLTDRHDTAIAVHLQPIKPMLTDRYLPSECISASDLRTSVHACDFSSCHHHQNRPVKVQDTFSRSGALQ